MFLKNHRVLPWICCILAAFLLSSGLVVMKINSRYTNEIIYETIFRSVENKDYEEYIDVENSEESWESINTEEETKFGQNIDLIDNAEGFLVPALLAAGVILGSVFIFFMRQDRPYAGPEVEIFVFVLSIILFFRSVEAETLIYWGYYWIIFCLFLISVRGLWSWLRNGFSLRWSTGHRLGLAMVGDSGKQSRYLTFQLFWSIAVLAAYAMFLYFAWQWQAHFVLLMGISCVLTVFLSSLCFTRMVHDMDHLSEQITHLHQGSPVSVREGVFQEEEEKLLDLLRQRDEAVQTAVTSERFRVDLIANVSHDLRTPLTAILGYGELLRRESLSPLGTKQLEELNQKAGYMRDLVESLFELTKVSSGAVESKKEEIDLIRLLEQTIGLFDDQLNNHNLQIRRHYEMDSLPIVTDGARMHQVFANLIGNAIKYTLPGTRIHLEVRDGGEEYIVRMVNIASYEMDFDAKEIVQRFARGDKARTTKGSGLGLAIAQTYTESVGGSFQVLIDGEQFSAVVALPKMDL